MANRFGIANIGFGMGLRTVHFPHILEHWPQEVDWFEITSENFMDTSGRPVRVLEKIAARYPIVMHGVSLSIGSTHPFNKDYLTKLKRLAEWSKAAWVSDHLCWTGIEGRDTHDLLPVPYTREALRHVVDRIKRVQDFLGRPLILENPSTYLEFSASEMPEWEFIAQMAEMADCGLLLDANNVYVSCYNHGWDEKTYIDSIPADRVVQIHLAGHDNKGTHIVDTHEGPIIDPVWTLYRYILSRTGPVSTMVEWDTAIPEFPVVAEEVERARQYARMPEIPNDIPSHLEKKPPQAPYQQALSVILPPLQTAILSGDVVHASPQQWVRHKERMSEAEQVEVYTEGYRFRLHEVISGDLPALRYYLGDDAADALIFAYIEATPSESFNLSLYIRRFPEFVRRYAPLKNDHFAHALADMEVALTTIFDLEETPALTQDNVTIDPDTFFSANLVPRTALDLCRFDYPVSDYYRAFKNDEAPRKPRKKKSFLAIYRHNDTIYRLPLEEHEYLLLKLLFKDHYDIGKAIEAMIREFGMDEEKIVAHFQQWFGRWVQNNLLTAIAA